ncbi:hypothetical protein EBR44_12835 [bacterium]|nr:hypothetical protein [bacterium]
MQSGHVIRPSGDTVRGRAAIGTYMAGLAAQGGRVELRLIVRRTETCEAGPYESGEYAINRVIDARVLNVETGVFGIRWREAGADSVAIEELRLARDSAHFDAAAALRSCENPALARLRGHRFNLVVSAARSGYYGRDLTERLKAMGATIPGGAPPFGDGDGSYTDGLAVDLRMRFRQFNLQFGATTVPSRSQNIRSTSTGYKAFVTTHRAFAPSESELRLLVTREYSYVTLGAGVTQFATQLNLQTTDSVTYTAPFESGVNTRIDHRTTTWYSPTATLGVQVPLYGDLFLDVATRFRARTKETLSNGILVDHGAFAAQVGLGWALFR